MQTLRQRNVGDRLRGEFPTGRGTGEVLQADETPFDVATSLLRGVQKTYKI